MSEFQPILSAIKLCIDYHLQDFNDTPESIYQTASKQCQDLWEALSGGKPLEEDDVLFACQIASAYIDHLTYQCVYGEPGLPLLDLPERLQSAASIIKALEPLAHQTDYRDRWEMAIQRAKRLQFRQSNGAPFDYEVFWAEQELKKGTVVRAPIARSLSVAFGPTSWDASMGPASPGRIFVRLGQTEPATALLLIEQDRPHHPRSIRVFALRHGEKELLHEIYDQNLWYCEELDHHLANDALRGVHFSLWTPPAMFFVYLADLGSPLGVYVQIPLCSN